MDETFIYEVIMNFPFFFIRFVYLSTVRKNNKKVRRNIRRKKKKLCKIMKRQKKSNFFTFIHVISWKIKK